MTKINNILTAINNESDDKTRTAAGAQLDSLIYLENAYKTDLKTAQNTSNDLIYNWYNVENDDMLFDGESWLRILAVSPLTYERSVTYKTYDDELREVSTGLAEINNDGTFKTGGLIEYADELTKAKYNVDGITFNQVDPDIGRLGYNITFSEMVPDDLYDEVQRKLESVEPYYGAEPYDGQTWFFDTGINYDLKTLADEVVTIRAGVSELIRAHVVQTKANVDADLINDDRDDYRFWLVNNAKHDYRTIWLNESVVLTHGSYSLFSDEYDEYVDSLDSDIKVWSDVYAKVNERVQEQVNKIQLPDAYTMTTAYTDTSGYGGSVKFSLFKDGESVTWSDAYKDGFDAVEFIKAYELFNNEYELTQELYEIWWSHVTIIDEDHDEYDDGSEQVAA